MFEMGFQAEREMLFLERNRYIQVCRKMGSYIVAKVKSVIDIVHLIRQVSA